MVTIPADIITAEAALQFIANNQNLTSQELTQLAQQMEVTVDGSKVTLFYSGGAGDVVMLGGAITNGELDGGKVAAWQNAKCSSCE